MIPNSLYPRHKYTSRAKVIQKIIHLAVDNAPIPFPRFRDLVQLTFCCSRSTASSYLRHVKKVLRGQDDLAEANRPQATNTSTPAGEAEAGPGSGPGVIQSPDNTSPYPCIAPAELLAVTS